MTVVDTLRGILASRLPFAIPVASMTLPVLLSWVIVTWVTFDQTQDALVNTVTTLSPLSSLLTPTVESFDFIVVGAGSAGMIVASRLANTIDPNTGGSPKVLLLEAGGEPSPVNNIPSMDFFLLHEDPNTWVYPSETQYNASLNCDNQQTMTTRGKMLGGSSSTNFMMYVRGNKGDYDQYANIVGDNQWNYDNILPFFRKSENYQGAWPADSTYHGVGGLLNVNSSDYQPGVDQFLAAAREKGYAVGDYNGAIQEVFSPIDITVQDGWRESTYRAFYVDNVKPSNFTIRKYALVTKVGFTTTNGVTRANTVTYEKQGYSVTVKALKEVILSAGVFNSPQILMLSGVGPAADLQKLNIPVVKDLPVGQQLQDHCYTFVGPFPKYPSLDPDRDIGAGAAVAFASGSGPLAAPAGLAGTGFMRSPYAPYNYPDLQVVQFSVAYYPDIPRDINAMFGLNQTLVKQWWNGYLNNTDMRTLVLWLGKPRSVGTLTLRSKDPHDTVKIDAKYLSNPDDLEALLFGYKRILDMYENTNALNTTMIPNPVPGCENEVYRSDDYFRCAIRHISGSLYHHVGTCAMGSVVDSNLKVIGIQGLRVIDASVIPKTPNGNTNAPTIVFAEKGADILMKTYGLTSM